MRWLFDTDHRCIAFIGEIVHAHQESPEGAIIILKEYKHHATEWMSAAGI
jgi:hypothetical protein